MVETKKEECVTCGTGFLVRACSNCAVGRDAWSIVVGQRDAHGGRNMPPEIEDHAGRVGREHYKAINEILETEFGGQVTVKNLKAAIALHIQRQADLAEAQRLAAAAEADAQRLAHSRHLADRLERHSSAVRLSFFERLFGLLRKLHS